MVDINKCVVMQVEDDDTFCYEYVTAYQHKEHGHIVFVPDSLYAEWQAMTKDDDCWVEIKSITTHGM